MNSFKILGAAAVALILGPWASGPSHAAVVQTFGFGSAVAVAQFSADFSANTALASPYAEGGLVFSHTGFDNDNGGCGYAGALCVDLEAGETYSQAFSGNYFATVGHNAYLSIASAGAALSAIEFAADAGFIEIHLLWETWLDGLLTGTGKVSLGAGGVGGVIGLASAMGFDEVRLYAFDSASDNSGYSAPAIDSVRAFAVPQPGTWALSLAALGLLAGLRSGAVRRPPAA